MSRHNAFILCFFMSWIHCGAQVSDSGAFSSIAVRFGINQIRENNLLPKVHRGTITELEYGHEKKGTRWSMLHINLGYSRVKTQLEDISTSANLKINAIYSYNYRLVSNVRWHFFMGPEATLNYNASIYAMWDDSHLYWADYLSLGVSNAFTFMLKNGNSWISTLSLPVCALFSRPEQFRLYKLEEPEPGPIIKSLHSNIVPGHPGNVFFARFHTEYRFPVFKKKKKSFTYMLQFERVKRNQGMAFVQLIHQIGIKLYL